MSALRHIFSDKDQELLEAARCGKNETIEKLLRKRQTSGTNLLPSFLKSVNVNCVDREGNTPLHNAALNGHKSTVEILLRENASINVIDNRGCSPLHLASWNGHSDICLIFLTNQPELSIVNLQNGTGDTALHNASQFGYAATVEVLLQNFADPAIRNLKDESPLDLAARYGRLEVVQCLLTKYPELVRSSILNHSPLHLAAACGHKQIVELLLDRKYEINTKTDNGTALHIAAVYCKTEIAKLLLERGIDCCEVDKDGLTVLQLLQLHEKTQTSYVEVIKAIREHMALLESQKKMSATSAEAEAEETPVYDTLVEHVKPKPKPRLSIGMKSEDLEKEDLSSLYSKPIKDASKGPTGVSPQKSPTPPVPPRQSSINMLDGETSPVLRSISEVSNERDSANLTEKTEDSSVTTKDSVPLPAETKAVQRPRLPPKTRSLDDRRAVSMIDLPKPSKRLLPPEKSPVRIHSTNSKSTKSLNEELPAPCLGQEKAFSYLDMSSGPADSAGLLSKPQAKPTKPPRLKKSLSPTIERHKIQAMPKETETAESKKSPTKNDQNERTEYEVMSQVPCKQPHSPTIDTYSITVTRASLEGEIKGDNSSEDVKAANDGSEYYNLPEAVERESSGFTPSCVSPLTKTVDKTCNNGASIFAEYSNVSQVEKEKGGDGATPVQNEGDSPSGGVSTEKGFTVLAESRQEPQRSSKSASVVPSESDTSATENSKDKQSNEHSKASESNVRDSFYDNTDADLHVRTLSDQSQKSSDNAYSSTKHDIPDQVSAQKGDNCDRLICDTTSKSVSEEAEEDVGVDKRSSDRSIPSKDEGVRLSNGIGEDHPIGAPGNEEENYDEGETKIAKPPSLEFHKRRSLKNTYPLTPTGYVQPPTPDFPPPSPQTAIQGIHEKIAVIDPRNKNKRTSQDMETITDANLIKESGYINIPTEDQTTDIPKTEHVATGNDSNTHIPTEENKEETEVRDDEVKGDEVKVIVEGEEEVVRMRRSSKRESTSSVDDLVTDDSLGPFAGLLRGSVIYPPKKNNENAAFQRATNRKSLPTGLTFDTVKEEDMATIAMTNQEKPLSGMTQDNHDNQFDDSEEWAKIADIVSSFGGDIGVYADFASIEAEIQQLTKDTSQIQSIGDWLERIDLGQYENTLIANGFDDTDFLSEAVMDENDLQSIGITLPEHRKKILDAAKSMPQINPIDPDNPPSSLEEWLSSLHLLDLKDTFYTHKYETMDRVLKLWELELTSVLDISAIGHRKRILASLKNRPPADKRFPSLKRRTKDATDESTPFKDVNLYKDYTKVKPLASSEEDIKNAVPSPGPPLDSSEEEEVFRKDSQGKAIRDSTIHLRPPHLAHTTSPIRQWRHRPEMLIKGCCNYTAQYLGSTLVRELSGTESTIEGIAKLKKSADLIAKIPTIMLSISYKGVKFIDAKSKKVICDHEIGNIFCACQDAENMNFFAYITRDNQTGKHYCHVFSVRVADLAREIILTLGEAFEIAYQMALKERAGSEANEFERQLSQSDHDDTTSISSKASVNTV